MRLTPDEYKRYQDLWVIVRPSREEQDEWCALYEKLFRCDAGHAMPWEDAKDYPEGGCWKCKAEETFLRSEKLIEQFEKEKPDGRDSA